MENTHLFTLFYFFIIVGLLFSIYRQQEWGGGLDIFDPKA